MCCVVVVVLLVGRGRWSKEEGERERRKDNLGDEEGRKRCVCRREETKVTTSKDCHQSDYCESQSENGVRFTAFYSLFFQPCFSRVVSHGGNKQTTTIQQMTPT